MFEPRQFLKIYRKFCLEFRLVTFIAMATFSITLKAGVYILVVGWESTTAGRSLEVIALDLLGTRCREIGSESADLSCLLDSCWRSLEVIAIDLHKRSVCVRSV